MITCLVAFFGTEELIIVLKCSKICVINESFLSLLKWGNVPFLNVISRVCSVVNLFSLEKFRGPMMMLRLSFFSAMAKTNFWGTFCYTSGDLLEC